ncbi:hypothetical protein H0H93_003085, partial [Arthromyces matolae]
PTIHSEKLATYVAPLSANDLIPSSILPLRNASNSITIPPNIDNRVRAIVRIEKTALNPASASTLFAPSPSGILGKVKLDGSTDI